MPAVARRTATASGCSGGKASMSASTIRHVLSLSGSIAFTVEEYGLIHVRRSDATAALPRRRWQPSSGVPAGVRPTASGAAQKVARQLRVPAPRLGPHGGDDLGGELVQVGVVEVGPQHGQSPVEGTGEKVQAQSDIGVGRQFAARNSPLDELSGLGAPGIPYRLQERGGEVGVTRPFGEQIRNDLAG